MSSQTKNNEIFVALAAHHTHSDADTDTDTYRMGCGDAECLFAVKFEACNAYEIEFCDYGQWIPDAGAESQATTSCNNSI